MQQSTDEASGQSPTSGETDEATLKRQTDQWRALCESKQAAAAQAASGLAGVSSSQLAAVAADDGSGAVGAGNNNDLSVFLSTSSSIPPGSDTSSLTVKPFFHYSPLDTKMVTAPWWNANARTVVTDSKSRLWRGL